MKGLSQVWYKIAKNGTVVGFLARFTQTNSLIFYAWPKLGCYFSVLLEGYTSGDLF